MSTTTGDHVWRWAFAGYALALTIGLLWPGLTVPDVVPRPDLVVHGVTFGLFTWLLWRAIGRGVVVPRILASASGGVLYGAATEWAQTWPMVRRSGAVDDFLADCLGVALGAAVAWVVERRRRRAGQ